MTRTIALAALAVAAAASSASVFAADEYNTVPGLTAAGAPLGLHGVDREDRAGTIAKAEVNWGKIRHTAAKDL